MSHTYSSLQREVDGGRVFSSQHNRVPVADPGQQRPPEPTVSQAQQSVVPPAGQPVAVPPALMHQAASHFSPASDMSFSFDLTTQGLGRAAPIAPGASGMASVQLQGSSATVSAVIRGLMPPRDPAVKPTLWLLYDLQVPHDLNPADLAQLPRGRSFSGNAPGSTFTLNGETLTYGPDSNTVTISISPGAFHLSHDGTWQLQGAVDERVDSVYHPLVLLGPAAMPDINAIVSTGTAVRILTDLFLRPATVHPEMNLHSQFSQRLAAIAAEAGAEAASTPSLTPHQFMRAAVTLEGLVRATPQLMPTRETCFLMGERRR